jgi:hypothetical protein
MMDEHRDGMTDRDPSGSYGAIGTFVAAILSLLVAFGVNLDPAQQAAILGVVAAVGPAATALLIRTKAYAPPTVRHRIEEAVAAAKSGNPPPQIP